MMRTSRLTALVAAGMLVLSACGWRDAPEQGAAGSEAEAVAGSAAPELAGPPETPGAVSGPLDARVGPLDGPRANADEFAVPFHESAHADLLGPAWEFETPSGRHWCQLSEAAPMSAEELEGPGVVCYPGIDDHVELPPVLAESDHAAFVLVLTRDGGQVISIGGLVSTGFRDLGYEIPVLPYGEVLEAAGVACGVEETGVTCAVGGETLAFSSQGWEFSTDLTPG